VLALRSIGQRSRSHGYQVCCRSSLSVYVYVFDIKDADKARKHGLDEFVQASPSKFDHHEFFSLLQRLTLDYRLNDQFTCLVCDTSCFLHSCDVAAHFVSVICLAVKKQHHSGIIKPAGCIKIDTINYIFLYCKNIAVTSICFVIQRWIV